VELVPLRDGRRGPIGRWVQARQLAFEELVHFIPFRRARTHSWGQNGGVRGFFSRDSSLSRGLPIEGPGGLTFVLSRAERASKKASCASSA
jgi:hypothetical protein